MRMESETLGLVSSNPMKALTLALGVTAREELEAELEALRPELMAAANEKP